MKAIVTGGAGFIGSHIAEELLNRNHEVLIIDDLSAGKEENIPDGAWFINKDISKIDEWPYRFGKLDVIFHNAASKKNICLKDPVRDMEVNGLGTLKLLERAKAWGVKKFIHASTGSVYGETKGTITEKTPRNPISYYGISKTAGESYAMYYSRYINISILRYFHVWGDRQEKDPNLGGVVSIFRDRVSKGKGLTIHGDGNQRRLFTHVSDIVKANFLALKEETGTVFNCAAKEKTTINLLARMVMEKAGCTVPTDYVDPLPGDIYDFNVESALKMKFRNFSDVWKDV